ncbi:MAG TPA: hypothetical protein VHJ20_23570 [Polyangia bacterium]|nr:hypothetical protein [Polyangia bacterium]
MRLSGVRLVVVCVLAAVACTSSEPPRGGSGGNGGSSATGGTTGAGTGGTTSTGGDSGTGGTTSTGGNSGSTGTGGSTSTGGSTGSGGSTGAGGSTGGGGSTNTDAGATTDGEFVLPPDAGGRTTPTCLVKKPSPIPSQKPTNECDFLLQSLDFEDRYSYPQPVGSIRITDYGTALGYYEINDCSPYCFSKELTIGVDIVGGGDAKALQGEVIVRFPTTGNGLPIPTAVGRDSLAWIQLDGPTKPPFTISAQMVIETPTGIIVAGKAQPIGYANWLDYQHAEFKYFGINATTFPTVPMNVTGLGFRITAPANLPKGMEWHGVVYLDHLQMRTGAAMKDPSGQYPFGL